MSPIDQRLQTITANVRHRLTAPIGRIGRGLNNVIRVHGRLLRQLGHGVHLNLSNGLDTVWTSNFVEMLGTPRNAVALTWSMKPGLAA